MPSASDPRQQNRTRQPASRAAQPGQRPAQPTQRAAQSAARPVQSFSHSANLFNGRVSSLLLARFSIRLLTRLRSPLLVRPSL